MFKNFLFTYSFTFKVNMLGERIEKNIMVCGNNKIDHKNKLNVGERRDI
jgi:hypothetical protein